MAWEPNINPDIVFQQLVTATYGASQEKRHERPLQLAWSNLSAQVTITQFSRPHISSDKCTAKSVSVARVVELTACRFHAQNNDYCMTADTQTRRIISHTSSLFHCTKHPQIIAIINKLLRS